MVEVYERRGRREVEAIGAASYPDPGGNWERWAANLYGYPATDRLERASQTHQQDLRGAGWRFVAKAWTPPPRQRRSTEDAGAVIVSLVYKLDPIRAPVPVALPTKRALSRFEVGLLQALADLLFYPTALEALAVSVPKLSGPALDWLRKNEYKIACEPRGRDSDPLRPRFSSLSHLVALGGSGAASMPRLGAGSPSYRVAESKGRTRARWDEVACKATSVDAGRAKNMDAVELWADARRRIAGYNTKWADAPEVLAALEAALLLEVSSAKPAERVTAFREALTNAGGTPDAWTDKAILARLAKARQDLEKHVRRIAPKADEAAIASGDKSLLAPLLPTARERAPRPTNRGRHANRAEDVVGRDPRYQTRLPALGGA